MKLSMEMNKCGGGRGDYGVHSDRVVRIIEMTRLNILPKDSQYYS